MHARQPCADFRKVGFDAKAEIKNFEKKLFTEILALARRSESGEFPLRRYLWHAQTEANPVASTRNQKRNRAAKAITNAAAGLKRHARNATPRNEAIPLASQI
jgi:hypothetical protein